VVVSVLINVETLRSIQMNMIAPRLNEVKPMSRRDLAARLCATRQGCAADAKRTRLKVLTGNPGKHPLNGRAAAQIGRPGMPPGVWGCHQAGPPIDFFDPQPLACEYG